MTMHTTGSERLKPVSFLKRLLWLLACICVGVLIGFVGSTVTGNEIWYTAVPSVIALGWLFFADPGKCELPAQRGIKARDDE